MSNLSIYKYFKGENTNPFDKTRQNTQHMFWFYESCFERDFLSGDFSSETWIPGGVSDRPEWEKVLAGKPVDKEELFKLWLFYLLMDRLVDKYESEPNTFLRLYYDTEL